MKNLIFVACHAPFKETVACITDDPAQDKGWVLQSFQRGEPPLYIEHIRRGVELAAADSDALLIFSGGFTRREAGPRWSEAATYLALARHFQWWGHTGIERRSAEEDYSRDSFENLLFSICQHQQITGSYPGHIVGVSWAFKENRFYAHANALRLPKSSFSFEGCGEPVDLASALRSEAATQQAFQKDRYGSAGVLKEKRELRNPFRRQHPFRSCPGLASFFDFMRVPENAGKEFVAKLPWE